MKVFQTEDYSIRYWEDAQDLSSLILANDASFNDNQLDRKFPKAISWNYLA